jgi:hypothetical protein
MHAGSAKAPPSLWLQFDDIAVLIFGERDSGIPIHPGSPLQNFVSLPFVRWNFQR